jgi:NitT/TauT family transport system permease protein
VTFYRAPFRSATGLSGTVRWQRQSTQLFASEWAAVMADETSRNSGVVDANPAPSLSKGRKRPSKTARAARGRITAVLSVFGGLFLWEIAGRYLVQNKLFLATPLQALGKIGATLATGELQHHAWVSTQEFLVGFIIASIAGILFGLVIARSELVANALNPWVSGIYATPVVAIAPLFILWFGIGIWSKVAVVVSLVIFPIIINTEVGIRSADRQLIEMVRAFGATPTQVFWKVSLPAATPFILAGLRLGVGRGLIGVVVGELFGSRAGLGFMIVQASEVFDMPLLFAGILVLAAAGIAMTAGFRALERQLVPWHYQ